MWVESQLGYACSKPPTTKYACTAQHIVSTTLARLLLLQEAVSNDNVTGKASAQRALLQGNVVASAQAIATGGGQAVSQAVAVGSVVDVNDPAHLGKALSCGCDKAATAARAVAEAISSSGCGGTAGTALARE